jgi:hypothetical protein
MQRLWFYRYEGAMLRYLQGWIDQLRWQRLRPFEKLAAMLLDRLDGILDYCRTKVPLGVVEAVNGNGKSLLRRGRNRIRRFPESRVIRAERTTETAGHIGGSATLQSCGTLNASTEFGDRADASSEKPDFPAPFSKLWWLTDLYRNIGPFNTGTWEVVEYRS